MMLVVADQDRASMLAVIVELTEGVAGGFSQSDAVPNMIAAASSNIRLVTCENACCFIYLVSIHLSGRSGRANMVIAPRP